MSKRKGISAEEKRTRMLQLFYEKREFFQLKELEKIAPKEKGIIAQSVKDVIQSLVDDGLVDTDKIGTSVYFWAFPSKAKHIRKRKVEELMERLEEVTKKVKKSMEELQEFKLSNQDIGDNTELLSEIAMLRVRKEELESEVKKHKDNDPEVFEAMKKQTEVLKEASNRWTDNIFSTKKWCMTKFMIEEGTLNKQFGISPELDYIP